MSIGVPFTCISILYHIYRTQLYFKHAIFNMSEGMNKVFELN